MTTQRGVKDIAYMAWIEAWDQARRVEDMDEMTRRTATTRFEQWWEMNYDD